MDGIGYGAGVFSGPIWRKRTFAENLGETPSIDEFHRDERLSVRFPDIVYRDDVRMTQGGRGLGLAAESPDRIRARVTAQKKQFQGDHAIQANLARTIDHPHPAMSDGTFEQVITQADWAGGLLRDLCVAEPRGW